MPFVLKEKREVCDSTILEGLMQILIEDETGESIAGAQILVMWENNTSAFFTGLFPSIDPGYADYQMNADVVYRVQVGENGEIINDLTPLRCDNGEGEIYTGGWLLRFAPSLQSSILNLQSIG